jgi:hypothetical protein
MRIPLLLYNLFCTPIEHLGIRTGTDGVIAAGQYRDCLVSRDQYRITELILDESWTIMSGTSIFP